MAHRAWGRVLFMDDDEGVRDLARQMLQRLSYDVEVAGDGDEAIALFSRARERGEPFDIVILDLMVQGGKGGLATFDELKRIQPSIRAVLSSGLSPDTEAGDYLARGFSGIIPKPYRIGEIDALLQSLLGGD